MDQDRKFLDNFIIVIGALIAFTVLIYFIGTGLERAYLDPDNVENPIAQAAVGERLQPVGEVLTTDDPQPQPQPAASAAADTRETAAAQEVSGKEVYDSACIACHGSGAAGAPRIGDAPAWADRIAKGEQVMYDHAINGFQGDTGFMPPKGGRADLSDEQVQAAVDYMIEESQ